MKVFSDSVLRDLQAAKLADGRIGSKNVQVAFASALLELGEKFGGLTDNTHFMPVDTSLVEPIEMKEIKIGGTD